MSEFTRLDELSKEIDYFTNILKEKVNNNKVIYHLKGGDAESQLIFEDDEHKINIMKTYAYAGVEFGLHLHKNITEWLFILKGSLNFVYTDKDNNVKKVKLNEGDYIEIPPNTLHRSRPSNVDCEFIAITMPSERSFIQND